MSSLLHTLIYKLVKRSNPKIDEPEDRNQGRLSGRQLFNDLLDDLRLTLRDFIRKPLFPIAAIASLAIGIGLNTALFSYFNGAVFTPIAAKDPSTLYRVKTENENGKHSELFSYREYIDLRDRNQVFQDVIADHTLHLNTPDGKLNTYLVTGNYFESLGTRMLLGRSIRPDDDQPSSPSVLVLGSSLWRDRFNSDPQIVGKQIELATKSFTVIGVVADEISGLDPTPIDVWAPLSTRALFTGKDYLTSASDLWLRVVGRLNAGVTLEQARSSLDSILPEITKSRENAQIATHVILDSRESYVELDDFNFLVVSVVLMIFGLVLIVACSNVAIMQVARALSRWPEIEEHFSQGRSRGRIVRMLFAQSLPILILGYAFGLALSHGLIVLLRNVILDPDTAASRYYAVTLDFRIFAFALFLSLIAGVIVGLAPAFRSMRLGITLSQKKNEAARQRNKRQLKFRQGYIIAQCAMVFVVLCMAGATIRHQLKLSASSLGFDVSQALFLRLERGVTRLQFWKKLSETPGVVSVANQTVEPLYNGLSPVSVSLGPERSSQFITGYNSISPDYFKTLNIPILQGRAFTTEDAVSKADSAIISQATAQRFWPGQNPIGKQLTLNLKVPRTLQVIGVSGGVINKIPVDGTNANFVYLPLNPAEPSGRFLVRVQGDPGQMQHTIRAAISAAYPIAEFDLYNLKDWVNWASYRYKVFAWVSSALGLCCLLFLFLGIYGAREISIATSSSETGVGATLSKVDWKHPQSAFKWGLRLVIVSIGGGILLVWGISYLIPDPLIRRYMTDPMVLLLAGGCLVAMALFAAYLPSRKFAAKASSEVVHYEGLSQAPASEMAFKLSAEAKGE